MTHSRASASLVVTLGSLLLVGAGCFGSPPATTDVNADAQANLNIGTGGVDDMEQPIPEDRGDGSDAEANVNLNVNPIPPSPPAPPRPAPSATKEFKMTMRSWEVLPATITVKEGDKVKLVITGQDADHGIAIPAFGVSQRVAMGTTQTVEFTADKKGTYPMFCNVFCGNGHSGMRATLIVE